MSVSLWLLLPLAVLGLCLGGCQLYFKILVSVLIIAAEKDPGALFFYLGLFVPAFYRISAICP